MITCMRTGQVCTMCQWQCMYLSQPYTAPNMGWQCPLCRVVHAPTVTQCHCQNMLGGPTLGPVASGNAAAALPDDKEKK